jgi:hypothetical protein
MRTNEYVAHSDNEDEFIKICNHILELQKGNKNVK